MVRVAVCVAALVGVTAAQLTVSGVRCGQLNCQLGEYCSEESARCAPCADVCNRTHHNYDPGLCVKECQDYIHDLRYMRRDEVTGDSPDFKSVQKQAFAAIFLSLMALIAMLVFLIILCVRFFRGKLSWKCLRQKLQPSKNRVKQQPADLIHHNPHAEMARVPKNELKLDIRNPEPPKRHQPLNVRDLENRNSQTEKSQGATTPKTMSTCLSNRHPAEDTTLDYSYDNKALNVTPPPVQAAASHNF